MLLDDIVTDEECSTKLSQEELNYAIDLIGACAECLRTSGDEIVAELSDYRRSARVQMEF